MGRSFEGSSLESWQSAGSGRLQLAAELLGELDHRGHHREHHTGLVDRLGLEREQGDPEAVRRGKEHPGDMMAPGSRFVSTFLHEAR